MIMETVQDWIELKVDVKSKLGVIEYETDAEEHAHITIDPRICEQCPHRRCVAGCPAQCYEVIEGKMIFRYEDCVECGTCFLLCDQGSVKWANPHGGFGVKYQFG